MPVLPVTRMLSSEWFSANRAWRAVSVGARWRSAMAAITRRFTSSGKGAYLSPVLRPASTWATLTLR